MAKLKYKDKPPYKAVYGIEAAFHQRAVLMLGGILKEIGKELNADSK